MTDKPKPFHYHAYILRLWQEGPDAEQGWRFSLEDTRTGRRRGFGSLAALIVHLQQIIAHGGCEEAEGGEE